MKKTFVTNLSLLLLLNFLIKPFWIFGIDRNVQIIVGANEYGLYFSLFNFSMLLNIVLDIGITNFNNRNIAQNPYLVSKHFSNMVVVKILLGFLYTFVSVGIAFLSNYNSFQLKMLLFLILNQFIWSFILYLRSNISGLHLFKTDSLISVMDKFLMIIFCGSIIWLQPWGLKMSINWFIYAQTFAYILTCTLAYLVVLYNTTKVKIKFDFYFILVILKQSYPYALLVLLMSVYYRLDSVLLERLLPDGGEQTGIYAQAFRIIDALTQFSYLFGILLLPMFARMIKNNESINQLVKLSYFLLMIPCLIVCISSLLFGNDIMNLLYPNHVEYSTKIFYLLIISFVFNASQYITGTLLTSNGNLKLLNILSFIGIPVNLGLNLILIPKYQAIGAAIANLSTQAFIGLAQLFFIKRIFHFRFSISVILTFIVFILICVASGILIKQIHLYWLINLFLLAFICLIYAILLKLLDIKNLWTIVRKNEI